MLIINLGERKPWISDSVFIKKLGAYTFVVTLTDSSFSFSMPLDTVGCNYYCLSEDGNYAVGYLWNNSGFFSIDHTTFRLTKLFSISNSDAANAPNAFWMDGDKFVIGSGVFQYSGTTYSKVFTLSNGYFSVDSIAAPPKLARFLRHRNSGSSSNNKLISVSDSEADYFAYPTTSYTVESNKAYGISNDTISFGETKEARLLWSTIT